MGKDLRTRGARSSRTEDSTSRREDDMARYSTQHAAHILRQYIGTFFGDTSLARSTDTSVARNTHASAAKNGRTAPSLGYNSSGLRSATHHASFGAQLVRNHLWRALLATSGRNFPGIVPFHRPRGLAFSARFGQLARLCNKDCAAIEGERSCIIPMISARDKANALQHR